MRSMWWQCFQCTNKEQLFYTFICLAIAIYLVNAPRSVLWYHAKSLGAIRTVGWRFWSSSSYVIPFTITNLMRILPWRCVCKI